MKYIMEPADLVRQTPLNIQCYFAFSVPFCDFCASSRLMLCGELPDAAAFPNDHLIGLHEEVAIENPNSRCPLHCATSERQSYP